MANIGLRLTTIAAIVFSIFVFPNNSFSQQNELSSLLNGGSRIVSISMDKVIVENSKAGKTYLCIINIRSKIMKVDPLVVESTQCVALN